MRTSIFLATGTAIALMLSACGQGASPDGGAVALPPRVNVDSAAGPAYKIEQTPERIRAVEVIKNATDTEIKAVLAKVDEYRKQNPNASMQELDAVTQTELLQVRENGIGKQEGKILERIYCTATVGVFDCARAANFAADATNETEYTLQLWQSDQDLNERNAFKHAYWNALMAQYINWYSVGEIGDIHEQVSGEYGTPPSNMDLNNNAWGRYYGYTYQQVSKATLKTYIVNILKAGNLTILQRGVPKYQSPLLRSNTYADWGNLIRY